MSHDKANKVALAALQSRVEDLPDAQVQTAQLAKFLDRVPLATKVNFASDVLAAGHAIELGVVAATTTKTHKKNWGHWCRYTATLFIDPSSKTPTPSFGTQSSRGSLLGSGRATTAKAVKSKFKELLMPFQPSARPWNWLASEARSTDTTKSTPSPPNPASEECSNKIPPQCPK